MLVSQSGASMPILGQLDPVFGSLQLSSPQMDGRPPASSPTRLVCHPSVPVVFGLHPAEGVVAVYAIAGTAVRRVQSILVGPSSPPGAVRATSLALATTGHWLGVGTADPAGVATFTVEPTSGALTAVGWVAAPAPPSCLRGERLGALLYAAAPQANTIFALSLDPMTGRPLGPVRPLVQTSGPGLFLCKDRHFRAGTGGRSRADRRL